LAAFQRKRLRFFAVFVYATHATQAIAFEWKQGLSHDFYTESKTTSSVVCCSLTKYCPIFIILVDNIRETIWLEAAVSFAASTNWRFALPKETKSVKY